MKIKKILRFLKEEYKWFPYMPWTIYFNFHYLPLKQAMRLPIWLYKPNLVKLHGSIKINCLGGAKMGMIRLGYPRVSIYPGRGIMIENRGTILFNGSCFIGSDCNISVGSNGVLKIGHDFTANANVSIISHYSVEIKEHVLVGWDSKIMDTDFHQMKSEEGVDTPKSYSPVIIGNGVWMAHACTILHGTIIPDNCVIGAHSLTNKEYRCPEHTLLAGTPAKTIKKGVWLDVNDCIINYKK